MNIWGDWVAYESNDGEIQDIRRLIFSWDVTRSPASSSTEVTTCAVISLKWTVSAAVVEVPAGANTEFTLHQGETALIDFGQNAAGWEA